MQAKGIGLQPFFKEQQANVEAPVPSSPDTDSSKRRFLVTGLVTAGAAPKLLSQAKESVARLEGKRHTKRESNHSSGIYQSGTLSTAMYILSSLCQQMPLSCSATCFYGVWFGRHNAADRQF